MTTRIPPQLEAMVLADQIYTDVETGKRVLAGTFNRISAPEFPFTYVHPAFLYLAITELRGRVKLELQLVDLSNLEIGASTWIEVYVDDPNFTVEIPMPLPAFTYPHEGVYELVLLFEGSKLGRKRIHVHQRDPE